VDHPASVQWNSCQIAAPHCQRQKYRFFVDVRLIGVSEITIGNRSHALRQAFNSNASSCIRTSHSRSKSRSLHCHVADERTLCRVNDATLSLLLVTLLSPESRSGPFGPKPSFGLLAFGLDCLNSAMPDYHCLKIPAHDANTGYRNPRKGKYIMNQDTNHQIGSTASAVADETPQTVPLNGPNAISANSAASQAIVQCLLIAARRGRQIRLAHEQAAQLRQSEQRSVNEETSESGKP
jgi:hypothetical protein